MTQIKRTNINQNTYKELSIQVSLSGLSFCVLDTLENKVIRLGQHRFENVTTLDSLLDQLDQLLTSNELTGYSYKRVNVIHENDLSTFVPKPLFSEKNIADYLKYNIKILENDYITYDEIPNSDLINVYVPYVHVNNFIFDLFGEFEYKHFSTVLVEALLNRSNKTQSSTMFVNVQESHFEIVVLKNRKLVFYNTFEYQTKEDFIYYILFTSEQLDLNPELFELIFTGQTDENSSLYQTAYKYIRNVSTFNLLLPFDIDQQEEQGGNYKQFVLLNSF